MTRLALWKMYNQTNGKAAAGGGNGEPILPPVSLPSLPALPSELLAQHAAQAAQAALQAAAAAQAEKSLNQQLASERKRVLEKLAEDDTGATDVRMGGKDGQSPPAAKEITCDDDAEVGRTMSPPPPKRARGEEDDEGEVEDEEVAVGDHRPRGEDGLDEEDVESRQRSDAEELARKAAVGLLPGANIKITSRGTLDPTHPKQNSFQKKYFFYINVHDQSNEFHLKPRFMFFQETREMEVASKAPSSSAWKSTGRRTRACSSRSRPGTAGPCPKKRRPPLISASSHSPRQTSSRFVDC